MPEHDEDGVVAILPVLGRPVLDFWRKLPKPLHQCCATFHVLLQRFLQIHTEEHVVRLVSARIVGCD